MSPLITAFPPDGSASTALQTLQTTWLVAWLKRSCSLPHFGHFTLRKLLLGLGTSLFQSLIFYFPPLVRVFILLLVFSGGCRLCVSCNRRLCILAGESAFWWFWRIPFAEDIFVHRSLLFRVRGDVRLLLGLVAFPPCTRRLRELDELCI
jgi:hypothetical protein